MREAERGPLTGRAIVVTRPAHQAVHLAALIRDAGAKTLLFPTTEIAQLDDQHSLTALIARLDDFDIAIFVSPNAVSQAMTLIKARRDLPSRMQVVTIGGGGARELARFGVSRVIAPKRYDSEALLDMPELKNVGGKRIVIFRGEGGRGLLGDTLAARGAAIEYAACYRRGLPQGDATLLREAWAHNELHAIVVTSSEGLRNLVLLVGASTQKCLKETPLFVPHPRIERTAHECGFSGVVLTGQGDEQIVLGLTQWFAGRH